MWPGLVELAKEGGANAIDTYVFWNGHELSPDNYYFEGRFDLVRFVKIVQQARMYMILRIGPFVSAEWNFGGVPVWLHYVPGTVFRTDNEPWKYYMEKFTTYIVKLLKQEKLFASQGGPIILAQIENEYGSSEQSYGDGGKRYAQWCAKMALSQNIGVPWIMCQQWDIPDPVINTCNAFYCHDFVPISVKSPKIWTENWPGWLNLFVWPTPHRPAEDIAYAVARFFQKGGSVHNYYMYHGGTNFGRTAGGVFITTSYDYDAPIDEYGLARFPKWGHLKELHEVIKLCEKALLDGETTNMSLGCFVPFHYSFVVDHDGTKQNEQAAHQIVVEAFLDANFTIGHVVIVCADVYTDASGGCAAFLSNSDNKTDRIVQFRNTTFNLPAWSVSILPDCKNVEFNSAKVRSQSSVVDMVPEELQSSVLLPNTDMKALQWEVFVENPGMWGEPDFSITGFVDQINITKDTTDYMWLTTSLYLDSNETLLEDDSSPVLSLKSNGHAVHVFVDQELQGSPYGGKFTAEIPISLKAGKNEIALLSMTVGLTIGLEGEQLNLYKDDDLKSFNWVPTIEPPKRQPLTWYKAVVDAPSGNEPIGLDMTDMWKGLAWLNGEQIGRYHIPRAWFKPSGNVLVIFEERGGDPTKIRFSKRKVSSICSLVSEDHPSISVESRSSAVSSVGKLSCPGNTHISSIRFASFGNP
ncbi:hypothetical protein KSS87_003555, partial [Heliosperma pusillum]